MPKLSLHSDAYSIKSGDGAWTYYYTDITPVVKEVFNDNTARYLTEEGYLHREDGPALTSLTPGSDGYFLHGEKIPKEEYEFWQKTKDLYKLRTSRYSPTTMTINPETLKLPETDERKTILDADSISDFKKSIEAIEKELDLAASELPETEPDWQPAEDGVDYEKYQDQIKKRAAEFLKTFDLAQEIEKGKKIAAQLVLENKKSKEYGLIESVKAEVILTKEQNRIAEEQLKIAEDLKDLKDKVNLIIDQESVSSYNEMSAFVGALINIGVVESKDFIGQINKCEKWPEEDYKNVRNAATSYMKGDLKSSLTQVKTLISKANNAVTSLSGEKGINYISVNRVPGLTELFVKSASGAEIGFQFTSDQTRSEKAERLTHILAVGNGKIAEHTLLKVTTPELTTEDVHYWLDHHFGDIPTSVDPHNNKSKKEIKNSKEIEKINNLLADNKLEVKDLEKYVALGIISSSGLKAWRIEDQAKHNYFYGDMASTEDMEESIPQIDHISDEEFDRLVNELTFKPTQFESEIHRAAYRVGATQLNKATRAAIIKALPEDKTEGMKEFLASELGSSFIGMIGGITLTYGMENNNTAQNLAKELRVASLASLGNEAAEVLSQGLVGVIKNAMAELPATSVHNEGIEELSSLYEEEQTKEKVFSV